MSDENNVTRLPVEHADIGVQLIEAIRSTPNIKAGIFLAIDDQMRATRIVLHARDATQAHLGLVIGDLAIVQHRLVVMIEEDDGVEEITDEPG